MTQVQNYIQEKFEKFADGRNILLLGTPTMCDVVILASTKGKTQHMAAPAEKDGTVGYIINIGDKKLTFFPAEAVLCKPLKDGSIVKNKARLQKSSEGVVFSAR